MTPTRIAKLKMPTAAQVAKRVDELVADRERLRLDALRAQVESQALAELTDELNRGHLDDLVIDQLRTAGMTFVRDVWPTHPAAGHVVGEPSWPHNVQRPCGVRRPFRLAEDGVWFCDYWVSSPLYPAGRTIDGAILVAFLVDGTWRYATPTAPTTNPMGYTSGGFDTLRSLGLRVNPEVLRGRPERRLPDGDNDPAFGGPPDRHVDAADAATVRHPDDLLWRFINATQNEAPSEVTAA